MGFAPTRARPCFSLAELHECQHATLKIFGVGYHIRTIAIIPQEMRYINVISPSTRRPWGQCLSQFLSVAPGTHRELSTVPPSGMNV